MEIQNSFLKMAYSEEMLTKRLKNAPFFVAEVDGAIVGFANYSNVKDDGETELTAIYMLPTIQNKGVGSKLLHDSIAQLSPKRIYVNVESDNNKGKQFYIAKGFEKIEEFDEDFDGHTLKTIRMALSLE